MGSFSIWHWAIVLVIVLLVFGPGKLPDVFKQAGKGIKAFRDAADGKEKDAAAPKEELSAEEEEEVRREVRRRRDEKRKQLADGDELDDDAAAARSKTARRAGEE